MTQYSTELDEFLETLFPPVSLPNVLGQVVANAGRTQLRIAETEKYPHVTYFLNGGEETPYPGQDSILVPSPKVATYDLQPEMSAPELTERAVTEIRSGQYDLNRVYFESRSFSSSGSRWSLTQRRSAMTKGSRFRRTSKSATRRVRSSALAWQG